MAETDSQPIAENEQVKELLALLKDNNTPGYEEFAKLIEHVTGMEQRLLEATEELKAVRQEMQGLQNHSLKDALQKSCKAMETNISAMRHRLSELKGQIINGCRNILADFRERGAVALNGITQFLHVRPALESIQNAAEKSMQASNRAVARIDAFSTEYHEMGRHLKNMGRTLQGKPAEADAKENGKVANGIDRKSGSAGMPKTERLPGCSKVLSKWRAPLYSPLTVMRNGHLIPLPGWNRLRKGALLFWKQCGNRQQKRNRQKSSRHLPMIRKAGNCQVHMKGGI